ncbi:hypothetical protein PYJP_16540 [Pyrofollis japonicus]|uniref:YncE family protein n=1 Tax=Pyrofollis japonicus TaxID=3060460 RepID=UPI00295C20E1|nr:DUF2341 domain-containing protein [Pyrofollis japonicus]BEP18302.1 hypothetical protein PYJP_16540 [Pyrofollis japonicus]
MHPRRSPRAIATIIGGVLLAIALLALLALYFYLQHQQQELQQTLSEAAEERINTQLLASTINGYYTYDGAELYIEITSSAPRAVNIININVLWNNYTSLVIDRFTNLQAKGIEMRIQSFNGATTLVASVPVALAPGDTLEIIIPATAKPLSITATISASPAVAVISIKKKPAFPANVTYPNVTCPLVSTILLSEPLSGYVVAEKAATTQLLGNYTQVPDSYQVLRGGQVTGSLNNLASVDGLTLNIRSIYAPLCPGLSGWNYMRKITISNPNSYSYDDIQIRIELNSTNFEFSHAKNDGSDIRILASDCTPLYYWIEKWDPQNGHAVIWVKIPHIDANSNQTVFLVYGNPSAQPDTEHEGLTKVMTELPANDGPGYTIYYQEWIMPVNGLVGDGNSMNWHADDGSWLLSLPFKFPYYDRYINQVYVDSNGFVSNHTIQFDWIYSENNLKQNLIIAPLWADLTTQSPHDIYVLNNYEDNYGNGTVIRWNAGVYVRISRVKILVGEANFELILYDNGLIRFNYGDVTTLLPSVFLVNPVVGLSLGDGRHYTIASYNRMDLNSLDHANSLMFWPRKKPQQELQAYVGTEESFNKYIIDIKFSKDLGYAFLRNIALVAASPSGVSYHYEIKISISNINLYIERAAASDPVIKTIEFNKLVNGLLEIEIVVFSDNNISFSLDKLTISYSPATLTEKGIYIASNSTADYILKLDTLTNATAKITLPSQLQGQGYIAISPYMGSSPILWVARGKNAAEYIIANNTWQRIIALSTPLGPGGFIAFNGTHLYYCPGDGYNYIDIYDVTTNSLVSRVALPSNITRWSSVAYVGSILYIHTGETNRLIAIDLATGSVTDLGQTPLLYSVGMDYGSSSMKLYVAIRGGGIMTYDTVSKQWGSLNYALPFYPFSPGDRLAIINDKIYFVRGDGTAQVIVIDIS